MTTNSFCPVMLLLSVACLAVFTVQGFGQFPVATAKETAKKEYAAAHRDKALVIAEGVGITADDSLKDAFRNAVGQVVGAAVEAETLVKNDQVIYDKVLTYSDGFIKTYNEISKVRENGLFKTKIIAIIQRRSVIFRLKAANIAVKDIDGKGIFAEIVSEMEAKNNAKQMIEKVLEGFPQNLLKTGVIRTEIIEKSEKGVIIRITAVVKVDSNTYNKFSAKLKTTLRSLMIAGNGGFVQIDQNVYQVDNSVVAVLANRCEAMPYLYLKFSLLGDDDRNVANQRIFLGGRTSLPAPKPRLVPVPASLPRGQTYGTQPKSVSPYGMLPNGTRLLSVSPYGMSPSMSPYGVHPQSFPPVSFPQSAQLQPSVLIQSCFGRPGPLGYLINSELILLDCGLVSPITMSGNGIRVVPVVHGYRQFSSSAFLLRAVFVLSLDQIKAVKTVRCEIVQ